MSRLSLESEKAVKLTRETHVLLRKLSLDSDISIRYIVDIALREYLNDYDKRLEELNKL